MISLVDTKLLYSLSCLVLCLLAASPAIVMVVSLPRGEPFSELWLLGADRLTEGYPFNVTANQQYRVHVGIGNHLGHAAYYRVLVKFKNQSELLPNVTTGEPSPLPPLFEYQVLLEPARSWEAPLTFGFHGVSFHDNQSRIERLEVNGLTFPLEKMSVWDAKGHGFYYELFLELWLYDAAAGEFSYHNRFVGLWLNVTGPSPG